MGESPVKKLDFETIGKENIQQENTPVAEIDIKKPSVEIVKAEKEPMPVAAPTIKETEADEPLLQENPHRFVLFPIKYHEVSTARRVSRKLLS